MPKKSKTPKRTQARKKGKKSNKRSSRYTTTLQTIKVHPHLANAIRSLKKFSPEELEQVKTLSRTVVVAEAGQSTGCWISDSGGQQHCVNLPPDVCTRQGGISVPTRCPNA
jgi:hypothetical protein